MIICTITLLLLLFLYTTFITKLIFYKKIISIVSYVINNLSNF